MEGILELVMGGIPLAGQATCVSAARVFRMGIVQAVVIGRAHLAHVLIAGHVAGKTAQKLGHTKAFDCPHIVLHVVLPAQPATMASIEINCCRWVCFRQSLHGIPHSFLVCALGSFIPAPRVTLIRGQVGQRIRLDDKHNWHLTGILRQNLCNLVDIFRCVLPQTFTARAITNGQVITTPILLVAAAKFTIGCLRMAVAVGQVIHDEDHQLRLWLGCSILQNALHTVRAAAEDLVPLVQPVG
mmetsp:Transcript_47187/g.88271  ORF Transcript_47187/g.88271 Transcript_47187/m.88271 type:complete len:242 (+) Transcript_47187:784-1509(+)